MKKLAVYPRIIRSDEQELGPGHRLGIWVQGCSKRCSGCTSPGLLKFQQPLDPVNELAERLLAFDNWSGLTISGGEPFEQAEGLLNLIKHLRRQKPLMNILIYSGFDYEELLQRPSAIALLAEIDGLIDGEYMESIHRNFLWFGGSENQTFRSLSSRSKHWVKQAEEVCNAINAEYRDTVYQLIQLHEFDVDSYQITRNPQWWSRQDALVKKAVEQQLTRLCICVQSGSFIGIPPKNFRQNFRRALKHNQIELSSN